jgi:hypothetical protein
MGHFYTIDEYAVIAGAERIGVLYKNGDMVALVTRAELLRYYAVVELGWGTPQHATLERRNRMRVWLRGAEVKHCPDVIPPLSVVEPIRWRMPQRLAWLKSRRFVVGYYLRDRGFDFICIHDGRGNLQTAITWDDIVRYFLLVAVSSERDLYGAMRLHIGGQVRHNALPTMRYLQNARPRLRG